MVLVCIILILLLSKKDAAATAAASDKSAKINIIGRREEIKQFLTAGQSIYIYI